MVWFRLLRNDQGSFIILMFLMVGMGFYSATSSHRIYLTLTPADIFLLLVFSQVLSHVVNTGSSQFQQLWPLLVNVQLIFPHPVSLQSNPLLLGPAPACPLTAYLQPPPSCRTILQVGYPGCPWKEKMTEWLADSTT